MGDIMKTVPRNHLTVTSGWVQQESSMANSLPSRAIKTGMVGKTDDTVWVQGFFPVDTGERVISLTIQNFGWQGLVLPDYASSKLFGDWVEDILP